MSIKAIIITGPTASGKSDFAHKLALAVNGAIINCDSVQIYRGIENISASPFAGLPITDNIDGVPYKLFSILPLDKHISVADYLELAGAAMDEVVAMGKTPIFVGGTGYYINVLLKGIASVPEISEETRKRAREMVKCDINAVRKLLPKDFEKNDPQRTARALEVFLETGKSLRDWQKQPRSGALIPDAYKILVLPEREVLLDRIAKRIPQMIHGGAMDEAKNIISQNQDETRAIGATQICKMLRGELSEKDAIENWIVKTNQYAKRQRTWFRGQYDADLIIENVPTDSDVKKVVDIIC
ncbi:MAG: tRNA (adenosine(37)-N6)-dimethylallyltransferase MiaA [Alphaproteobacteria bacterium]|nr:tRNA (adenosine(37)-N6)-dimethylallyltransferase MiaA [Alphaproteobacteria bacterium]